MMPRTLMTGTLEKMVPKEGDVTTIPMWIGSKELDVRCKWTGEMWVNIDQVSFPPGSITIAIQGDRDSYTDLQERIHEAPDTFDDDHPGWDL